MSKTLTASVTTQRAAQAKRPVHLYRLSLTYLTLRFAAAKTNLVYPAGGDTWTAKTVQHSTPPAALNHSGVGRAKISIADGEGEILAYHLADNFKKKQIEILRVYRDALSTADDYVDVFTGIISAVSWDYQWVHLEVESGDTLRTKLPRRGYTVKCPWLPGGAECNADGLFDVSGAPFFRTGTMTGLGAEFEDANRTEADDYWKWGRAILKNGTSVYERMVSGFSGGVFTLDRATPITTETTVDYEVWRGCDQTWETCSGFKAYGPSADNHVNYGGFLHVRDLENG